MQTDGPECPPPASHGPRALGIPPHPAFQAKGHLGERRNTRFWKPQRPRAHGRGSRQVNSRQRHATHGRVRQLSPSDPLTTDH